MNEKKYYWKMNGYYYEVPKETYQKLKKDYDHAKLLKKYEAEVTVLSLDAVTSGEHTFEEFLSDPEVNVEETAIHNILLETMRTARNSLSPDEKLLLELLFDQRKSQEEVSKITGIPRRTISYRLKKILYKMRKIMGVKK